MFACVSVWCIGVVLPVNYTGGNLDDILDAAFDTDSPAIQLGPGQTVEDLASRVSNNT